MNKKIIGLCGFIGSGKDTAADYLVNFHGFKRESFASSLKDAVSAVFNWDRELLEGRTNEARIWREQRDDWWSNRLNMNITPRWILQYWGTEVCRKGFHNDIWIANLENKLSMSKDNIVISDCRFSNEIQSLKEQGAKIIWIQRGELPRWYTTAVEANQGNERALEQLNAEKIHASEYSWAGTNFDMIIDNNHSIEHLYNQLKNLVQ